ncbi:archease [Candidatus Dependentiae bacterium Noda2021]|nr:archease [Candidatus Dependentiae bacterium Noda2021]
MPKDFELIPHTADIKLRVYGATHADLFKHAVVGMFQSIHPQAPTCHIKEGRLVCEQLPISRELGVNSPDINALLVDFLSYALYLSDVHNEAYLDATIISISDTFVKAILHGVAITGFSGVEIKAVTYHDLSIHNVNGEWQTDIVFDI